MKGTVAVDIGGTFTDCLALWEDQIYFVKTPTTGYDLSVGFMKALKEIASNMEIPIDNLLSETEMILYSTTIAMNRLIERKGSLLGLITTEGFEDTLVMGKGAQWSDGLTISEMRNVAQIDKPIPLVPREMIVGTKERIDSRGEVIRPLDEEDFKEKLQHLVNRGARGFVVCLLWGHINSIHEKRIRQIIEEEYPESYLGSMPIVLSHEVMPKIREYPRTVSSVLNTYLHQSMAEELKGMGDELRILGYKQPMMMIHNTGGMAEVFRTTAVQTYNGGPIAGLIGSAYMGELNEISNVIMTDMGGTSFDLGLIIGGSPRSYAFQPVIDRWMMDITMLETQSIGAGGGSIAWINDLLGKSVSVGPQSAGSMPGPACYDQGGDQPTVTDANVVLGYINPEYYHGGRMFLNKENAFDLIKEKIARPLQIDVTEAALIIKNIVDGNMGNAIFRETVLRGFDPKNFILFAFGGAGPTHCCGYGFHAGVKKIVTFPFSPVFCAFASTTMDIVHIHEHSIHIPLLAPTTKECFTDYERFNDVVKELQERALKEMRLEGFSPRDVIFELDLDMKFGGVLNILRIVSPLLNMKSEEDVRSIYEQFVKEYVKVYSPYGVFPEGGVDIENLCLRAISPRPKPELPTYENNGEKPSQDALKGKRLAYWEEYGDYKETSIYEQAKLQCGNIIEGPAIVEAESTTITLPPGAKLVVDRYLCGIIERI